MEVEQRQRRKSQQKNENRKKKALCLGALPLFSSLRHFELGTPQRKMSTMRSRVLLLATAVLLVTGGAAAQAVFSEPDAADAAPAPRKRASVAEPDAADAAPVAPRRAAVAPAADDVAPVAAPATTVPAAPAAVSAVADAGGSEEPQGLRPKTQLATKYEPGQKILNDEGLPLVDRYVAGSLLKSVKDSGSNTVCEMVLQGKFEYGIGEGERLICSSILVGESNQSTQGAPWPSRDSVNLADTPPENPAFL